MYVLTHVNFSGKGSVYSQMESLALQIPHVGRTASHLIFRSLQDWHAVLRLVPGVRLLVSSLAECSFRRFGERSSVFLSPALLCSGVSVPFRS